ncbi:MAG: GTP-binding protein [Candidatus Moraniibacteriota bacterium]|nr:MAG: GTP-binding protein [Candidatus Moranbacteria bacterium]
MSEKLSPVFKKIPVTILTGFLGAGKTTLLNHILSSKTGEKIVVIVNEFGAVGIDGALVVGGEEHLVTLDNGCICCTVRNDLVETLTDLLKRKLGMAGEMAEAGESAAPLVFDRIVIETTGLADPIPLVQTFMMDDVLMAAYEIAAIVTVVDAVHIEKQLGYLPVAAEQIALADLILLSKTDLFLGEGESEERKKRMSEIESKIQAINPAAPIIATVMGVIPNAELFRERRFFAAPETVQGHDHTSHTHGISSVVLKTDKLIDIDRLYAWIGELQNSLGPDLLRYKGIIYSDEYPGKHAVLQGVHALYTVTPDREWKENEKRESVIVVIGQNLDREAIEQGFKRSLAD